MITDKFKYINPFINQGMVRVLGYNRRSRKGKLHSVNSYNQTRQRHRGKKGDTFINRKGMGTFWLKDRKGKFIGRADKDMKTETERQRIKVLGKDTTNISQEKKPARIYGRTKGITTSIKRRF